jgi:transposase
MLSLSSTRIWLCTQPVDARKSYDGLAVLVKNHLQSDPLSGHMFVFINRRRTQMKCLYFDVGGYCIWSKRLECGEFGVPIGQGDKMSLSATAFSALVEGFDVRIERRRKRYSLHHND